MKPFRKKQTDEQEVSTDSMQLAYDALPDEKKLELQAAQRAEYGRVLNETLLDEKTQEEAENLAKAAVELISARFIKEYKNASAATPAQPTGKDNTLPPLPPAQPEAKKKYTFEFEIYEGGALKRTTEVSTLEANRVAALEIATAALKAELVGKETYRYTGIYKKQAVMVENI
jgi:hypothetical protein